MIKGFCECRRVQFEFDSKVDDFSHCHCSQCRRMHGAAYATFAGVRRDGFNVTAGADSLTTYASSSTHDRMFCSICGSNILIELATEPDSVYISMSAIDDLPELPPAYHIYVGSKAPWHEITDNAPQFEADSTE